MPVEFVRALIRGESNFNPASLDTRSNASGLLAITQVVVSEYNKRHGGTKYTLEQMRAGPAAAELALKVGIWQLRAIARNLSKFHPLTLAVDWTSKRWIEVLVLAWNAGYSEKGGVGKVADWLEKQAREVNLDNILAAKGKVAAVKYVFMPERHAWVRKVANWYMDELRGPKEAPESARSSPAAASTTPPGKSQETLPILLPGLPPIPPAPASASSSATSPAPVVPGSSSWPSWAPQPAVAAAAGGGALVRLAVLAFDALLESQSR